MTNNQIKPCHCGYQGELHGGHFCGCLTLTCPGCAREVQAFTVAGLIDAWNKPPIRDADEQDGREVNSCEPN